MDKTAIKKFAVWARRKLIEDIQQKAFELGISEKEIKEPQVVSSDTMVIGDRTLNKVEMEQRKSLVSKVKEKGFENVVEEVAYTWFNRFIALRFMEANEYLPTGVRVLSSVEAGKKEPDIIHEALNVDLNVDRQLIYQLQDANDTVGLYRYLLVKQCNALNEILPGLFEQIEDFTEILLPSSLLSEGSVIRELVESIVEEDFKEQVEIIGWMYQYYISEKKDEVFKGLKKNIKITKENIPAATQLFTPDWIVKYMVENSLGRLWLEGHPNDELKAKWLYYLDEAEQEPEVQRQLEEIREKRGNLKPEDIKVLDPAMGSGHILVYAFDVLFDIYKSVGYSERIIPRLILENNLYGLDIDDRAGQLAYFALMMKARNKDRRIFREKISLNLCSIQESNVFSKETVDFFVNSSNEVLPIHKKEFNYLLNLFKDAKEYGSILDVNNIDFSIIEKRVEEIEKHITNDLFKYQCRSIILEKIPSLITQAKILGQKFDIVATNPPYLGKKGMNVRLANFLVDNYPNAKSDLFAVFMEKCLKITKVNGFCAMVTMQSWMFLSSLETMRQNLLEGKHISSLVHMENMVMGIAFGTSATVWGNISLPDYKGFYSYVTIDDLTEDNQPLEFPVKNNRLSFAKVNNFNKIPGSPIAYWVSDTIREIFSTGMPLGEIAEPRQGMTTSDNQRFLRLWYEVSIEGIGLGFTSREFAKRSKLKWFPYNKGGNFRKWYGNNDFVVNYWNDGEELESFHEELNKTSSGGRLKNRHYYFKESLTWSFISSSKFGVRYSPSGFIFDVAGSSLFPSNEERNYLLAFLCTVVAFEFLNIQNPTMNFQVENIKKLPILNMKNNRINVIVDDNINIAKKDWDYFETSWDFSKHPLLVYKEVNNTIEQAFNNWLLFTKEQFNLLKFNEEELNRTFIELYGLQSELAPEVDDTDITIRKADKERDIKSFLSYAIGCIFGRYSLDVNGLIYAGGNFQDKWKFEKEVQKVKKTSKNIDIGDTVDTWVDATYIPDLEGVLPIIEDEYFEYDITSRFIEFLKVTFSEGTLEENLDYIADTLGRKASETSRQAIKRYFIKDFFRDHIQTYQKKPIYWLFDSGRQDGFKALIYMHRYDEFTVAKVRTDYLHKLQKSYEAEVKRLDVVINSSASERDKTNARKKKEKILKQMEECLQYDQVIAHVANQRIKIDLDDGVSVNYAKFQGVEIPQGEGKKPLKADLLAKI